MIEKVKLRVSTKDEKFISKFDYSLFRNVVKKNGKI